MGWQPGADWFQEMAELTGDVYALVQVRPDLQVEYLMGPAAQRVGIRPDGTLADGRPLRDLLDDDSQQDLDALLWMQPGQRLQVDLELNATDGETIWLQCTARCRERKDGSTVVDAVCHDITRLKVTQRDLATSERRHRLLVENAWDVIWTMGLDGTITYVSPAILRMRGFTPEEAMSQTLEEIHPPQDAAATQQFFVDLFTAIANGTELPTFNGEKAYYRKDGSIMTGQLQVIPHVDEDGNVVEILGVTRDISAGKTYEQELQRLAVTDPLTGLLNRRHAQHLFRDHIAQAHETQVPLSVLMIDVDHFKVVNDTYGHDAGDRALVALSRLLKRRTRASDVVARWGGEEFVIMLERRDLTDSLQFADDLRREVEVTALEDAQRVTLSVGVAQLQPGETLAGLLQRADKALYSAKSEGRNVVVAAP